MVNRTSPSSPEEERPTAFRDAVKRPVLIEAVGLERTFSRGSMSISALHDVSFRILAGDRVSIVGRSGSGKSTLLNLLAGLDRPTAGELVVADQRLQALDRTKMACYRLQTVGVVFQAFQLIPQRTAFQNVELPLVLGRVPKAERRDRTILALQQVGLQQRGDHFPWQMSGGEQQRVAIARALVNTPRLLLADEPTGNLDSATGREIVALLNQLCDEHEMTSVIVTHDEAVANLGSRRRLTMQDGRLTELSDREGSMHDAP